MSPSRCNQTNVLCSGGPYKPVPPPKPFAGYSTQMHYLQESQDSFPPARNGGPISYPHILVTDQGQFVTHSTKFPISEDSQKLVFKGNSRFSGGIDNPAMLPDAERQGENKDLPANHYAQMNANYDSSGRIPYSAQTKLHYGNHVSSSYSSASNSQPITTTETWSNNHSIAQNGSHVAAHQSPDKRHFQQSHQQQLNSANLRSFLLPNVPTSQQNGSSRTISFAPGATILNHHELYNEHTPNIPNGRVTILSSHMNGGPPTSQYTKDSVNITTERGPMITQDEHSSNAENEDNENRKDETKWGSLKKAGKTYSHLKNILSNKFNRGEIKSSSEDNSYGQNKCSHPLGQSAPVAGEISIKSSTHEFPQNAERLHNNARQIQEMQTSFQRAVQYSSLKARLEDHAPIPRQDPSVFIMSDRKITSNVPTSYHNNAIQMPIYRLPNETLASKRAESCSHLGSKGTELPSQIPVWSNHHRSDENLSRVLPSDHPYPDLKNKTASIHHLPLPRDGRVGSDSGRGTGGSGTEFKGHDTSLESGSSNRPHLNGQSSGNESEWIDIPDTETSSRIPFGHRNERFNYDTGATTPPLPPLSPEGSPKTSHKFTGKERKQSHSFSLRGNGKPDLLETTSSKVNECSRLISSTAADAANQGLLCRSTSLLPSSVKGWINKNPTTAPDHSKRTSTKIETNKKISHQNENGHIPSNMVFSGGAWKPFVNGGGRGYDEVDDEVISTDGALDLNSMLDGAGTEATTDDDLASRDDEAYVIRRQLEGLEGMYSEVLKALGSRRQGRHGESRLLRRRLHGSMSSLPSSVMSSRPATKDKKGRVIDDRLRRATKEQPSKTIHKRFQRLESHVVTLARSVAHLSSEMRTQQLMLQEMESIRNELSSLRVATRTAPYSKGNNNNSRGENTLWNPIESGHLALSNPGRVKKLTQFFGDEPPLVRIFLRKLGYEKYAKVFEEEKIGMLELPYLTEERLQKIGIPLGPRLRILQEAQGPIKREGNLSVYVV